MDPDPNLKKICGFGSEPRKNIRIWIRASKTSGFGSETQKTPGIGSELRKKHADSDPNLEKHPDSDPNLKKTSGFRSATLGP